MLSKMKTRRAMDLLGSANIRQAMEDIQSNPEYRKVLSVLLKNEIQILLQRLAEAGEESIVMTASVSDGSMSVIGSNFGEKFVLEPGGAVSLVTGFKEQFAHFCHNSAASAPKRARWYSYEQYPTSDSVNQSYCFDNDSSGAENNPVRSQHGNTSMDELHNDLYNQDDSDKAIDETVSQLVKNIFKQSEERERELGVSGSRGRRRRRRRTYGDHYQIKKGKSVSQHHYHKHRSTKIAQFFPAIPPARNESTEDTACKNSDNEKLYAAVEIKTEPNDYYSSEVCNKRESRKRETRKIKHDSRGKLPNETVENSVEKSIQKIIEMETRRRPSDSDSNESQIKPITNENKSENDTKQMEEKVKKIIENISKESDETKNTQVKTNTTDTNTKANDNENETLETETKEQDIGEPTVEIDVDETDLPEDKEWCRNTEEQFDVNNKSFEESSDDWPDENGSLSGRRRLKRNFIHNGYSYIRDKAGKGNTVYWKCGKIGCKGRVIQRGGERIRTQDHNHNPYIDS